MMMIQKFGQGQVRPRSRSVAVRRSAVQGALHGPMWELRNFHPSLVLAAKSSTTSTCAARSRSFPMPARDIVCGASMPPSGDTAPLRQLVQASNNSISHTYGLASRLQLLR